MTLVKKRIAGVIVWVLSISMVLGVLQAIPVWASAAQPMQATQQTPYKQKIISVVYDNSGSMDTDQRILYAKYSLQILLSLLGKDDVLIITPMNVKDDKSSSIEVVLDGGDCTDRIRDIVNRREISNASGGTPLKSVDDALDQLTKRGMKKVNEAGDEVSDKEYFLVILTDGTFDGAILPSSLERELKERITNYSALRTIYLGMGAGASDLSNCDLTTIALFTALKAATASDLLEKMQTVSNLISGTYALDPSVYTVQGKKLLVNMNKTDLPFRCLSVLLQNSGAVLESVTYNGQSLTPSQYSVLAGDPELKIKDGFSAVVNGSPYFSNGVLELTFSKDITSSNIKLMGEPALIISPYFEYLKDGSWERTDMQYINSQLTSADQIRVGYEVFEQVNFGKIDLNALFGKVSSSVLYHGKSYTINEAIPLVEGTNEISVTVSVMDGLYKLNESYTCVISDHPTYYRVESQIENVYQGDLNKVRLLYTVYQNNQKLSAAELNSYNNEGIGWSWTFTAKTGDGANLDVEATLQSDGLLAVVVDLTGQPSRYLYTNMKVVSPQNISRSKSDEINAWYFESLQITPVDTMSLQLTQLELLTNEKGLTFTLLADGNPVDFADAFKIGYTVDVDGVDVTQSVTVSGDRLTYVPSLQSLGSEGTSPGKRTITVHVASTANPMVTGQASYEFEILPTTLAVTTENNNAPLTLSPFRLEYNTKGISFHVLLDGIPVEVQDELFEWQFSIESEDFSPYLQRNGIDLVFVPRAEELKEIGNTVGIKPLTLRVYLKDIPTVSAECRTELIIEESMWEIEVIPSTHTNVDRFNINGSDAYFEFRVLQDGVPMGAERLTKALESQELSISSKTFDSFFWLPCGLDSHVEERNGTGVVVCRVKQDHFGVLGTFTAMFILNGEKNIRLSFHSASETQGMVFRESPWWSYVWRILVILFIVYTILYFLCGIFVCRSYRKGKYVALNITDRRINVNVKKINCSFSEKYLWHLQRWLPWKLVSNQPDRGGLTFKGDGTKGKGLKQETVARFRLRSSPSAKVVRAVMLGDGKEFENFKLALRKNSRAKLQMSSSELRGMFRLEDEIGLNPKVDGSYYATVNKSGTMVKLQFFIFL